MRTQLHRYTEWEELRFPYDIAVDAVLSLLPSSDSEAIARYSSSLEAFFGPTLQPALIESFVQSLLDHDR